MFCTGCVEMSLPAVERNFGSAVPGPADSELWEYIALPLQEVSVFEADWPRTMSWVGGLPGNTTAAVRTSKKVESAAGGER